MRKFTADIEAFHVEMIGLCGDADIAERWLQAGQPDNAANLAKRLLKNVEDEGLTPDDLKIGKDRLPLEISRLRRIELSAQLSTTVLDSWVDKTDPEEKADALTSARATLDDIWNGLIPSLRVTEGLLGLNEDETVKDVKTFFETDANPNQRNDIRRISRYHARTLGALARVSCGYQAIDLFDENCRPVDVVDKEAATEEQMYFGRDYAHGFGELAEDWELVRSNAAAAVRAESIKGGFEALAHTIPWIRRYNQASSHLPKTAKKQAAPGSKLTIAAFTQRGAVQSVRRHP